ncbi:type I 3-dehydroquinate dehydratase [Rhodococcus rhodochrous]|uniref:type I 3-dehydroquinate dehydratase n=1 Tax=Rhodococcus rhodochrous TaxID=1829 RepID=UPI001E4B2D7C|nr:type I 3-dehydroquinate dehydratase [Rhodococcus rhodochrous]MCD2098800.1 type I 3-dehydroquinate dehydratase [Rhodococcus rhodochrous]MCD2123322.1 type I 3-dehydroquinate dehydratase [Rhodococcus rhodochrous]MCQ4136042.1 type I 3-dehydroquinate dehydratase [Rhodococcus rhodochrous]MDJ0019964.1 type I 3-dehydroquinate dehydratase [Rhodococcus rhodochrous]
MNPVRVKDVVLGEGAPKIIVPLTGRTGEALLEQVDAVAPHADIVEWRVDFFDDLPAAVDQARVLADALGSVPLLATVRTSNEGGEITIADDAYGDLTVALAESGAVDLVDVEYRRERRVVERICESAHARKVAVVASNHDFDATPPKNEIVARLREMQELGADVCKIAVMPRSRADVLTLLDATRTMFEEYADRPLVTMSMGGLGVVSRLAGHVFGSAATFGMVGTASAPGQVDVTELRSVLGVIERAG